MATKRKAPKLQARASTRVNREPYGDPIRDAVARGDLARMRRLEATSVEWVAATTAKLADVKKALTQLRTAMKKLAR